MKFRLATLFSIALGLAACTSSATHEAAMQPTDIRQPASFEATSTKQEVIIAIKSSVVIKKVMSALKQQDYCDLVQDSFKLKNLASRGQTYEIDYLCSNHHNTEDQQIISIKGHVWKVSGATATDVWTVTNDLNVEAGN